MSPLTLEQILARSMRLQPAKASHHLSSAMVSSASAATANANSSSSSSDGDPSSSTFRLKKDDVSSKLTLPPSASATHRRQLASPTLDDAAYNAHRYLQHSQDREGTAPLASSSSTFSFSSHDQRVEGEDNHESSTFPTHQPNRGGRGLSSEEEKRLDGTSSRRSSSARHSVSSSPSQEDIIRGLEREAREAKESKYWFMASRERREAEEKENSSQRSASSGPTAATATLYSSSSPAFSSGGASDLASFLHTAIRLESWDEGIEAVCRAASSSSSSLPFPLPPSLEKLLGRPAELQTTQDENDPAPSESGLPSAPLPPLPLSSSSSSSTALSSTKQERTSVPETLLLQLLTLCEGAGRLLAVKAVGQYYGWRYPLILTRMVEILLKHTYLPPTYPNFSNLLSHSSSSEVEDEKKKTEENAVPERLDHRTSLERGKKKMSWIEAVLDTLARSSIPPSSFSVEVFNHILSVCEARKDCYGALYVIQSMGSNPLQALPTATIALPPDFRSTIRSKKSPPSVEAKGKENADLSAPVAPLFSSSPPPRQKDIPSTFSWSSPPVSPNVVSYASLIAVLEQAGENQFASYIVSLLPSQEKNEITASYAALIYLWSQQVLTKSRKHKR